MLYSLFEKGDGDVDLGWLAAAELVVAGGWRLAAGGCEFGGARVRVGDGLKKIYL